jgi:hypothetical protein
MGFVRQVCFQACISGSIPILPSPPQLAIVIGISVYMFYSSCLISSPYMHCHHVVALTPSLLQGSSSFIHMHCIPCSRATGCIGPFATTGLSHHPTSFLFPLLRPLLSHELFLVWLCHILYRSLTISLVVLSGPDAKPIYSRNILYLYTLLPSVIPAWGILVQKKNPALGS